MVGVGAVSARVARVAAPVEAAAAPACEREAHRARVAAAMDGATAAREPDADGRLAALARRFGLDVLESDILAVLWIGAFDPELRVRLASREPYAGQVTVRLVSALFGLAPRVRLNSESPLLQWQLAREHELVDGTAALTIDPAILAWLEGDDELDRVLAGRVRELESGIESPRWKIDALAARLLEGLQRGQRWRVHLATDDDVAARWAAAALGRRIGAAVLEVPAGMLAGEPEAGLRLQRQAFLDGRLPLLALEDEVLSHPPGVPAYGLQILHGLGRLPSVSGTLHDLVCELPVPDADERALLWRRLHPQSAAWDGAALADLALCHDASAGDIAAAAARAPRDAADAAEALRERSRGGLGALARRIDGRFAWDDLVLPAPVHERLRDIAFEGRERLRLWAEPAAARLFPYGRGLVALLAGPPGTGKTMAAQVIAADLGLDLLAVDLSAVVSKWVGETAQHLQQLLSSRTAQRSVLFFDEADALYAKRVEEARDAQDRYVNLDSSHLMSALENYTGIVLLASNLKASIDPAFLRRIRHVVDFPKPDAAARERLWRLALAALFPASQVAALEVGLARLARIEASGAVIKNAALSATFAARRSCRAPTLALLAELLARELAKEGAALSPRDMQALLEAAP